jgi:hypothetical protein
MSHFYLFVFIIGFWVVERTLGYTPHAVFSRLQMSETVTRLGNVGEH